MRTTLKQFASIASLTALEASRQPIFLLLTTATLLFIGLLPLIITHVIGDSDRMVRDSALALLLVSGLVLGCYAASATIARELKQGTLASIISKPVNRAVFFIAKFSGVALIMLVYTAIATMATMLSVRTAAVTFVYDWWGIAPLFAAVLTAYVLGGILNYTRKTPFVSQAFWLLTLAVIMAFVISSMAGRDDFVIVDHGGHQHREQVESAEPVLPWNIVPAGALIGMAIMLLCTFASTLSLKFELVPTVSLCFAVFIAGLMSDYLFGRHAETHAAAGLVYGILPNWQHFWAVDAVGRAGIPAAYTLFAAGYAALYGAVVLTAGILLFYRMEVK